MNLQAPLVLAFAVLLSHGAARAAEKDTSAPPDTRPFYLGTSAFVLANFVPLDYPPHFFQLNFGYELTADDRLSVEAISWRYHHPIGVPWGETRESNDKEYPGHVREYGVGVAYQRNLWRGVFASVGAVPFWRQYYDRQDARIADGFQLYLTGRLGYHLRLLDTFFLEPSVAFNYWPISTNVPHGFAVQDARWPPFFLLEPGLHIGVAF